MHVHIKVRDVYVCGWGGGGDDLSRKEDVG